MGATFTRFVGVDWSGAAPAPAQRRAIWTAVVEGGVLRSVERGRTREEATAHLLALAREGPSTVVGLDFAFSLPAWWMAEAGLGGPPALWEWARARALEGGERWPRTLPAPFWGTRLRRRPAFDAARPDLRRTEIESRVPGATPRSAFQLSGAGSVGTQSLLGHPALLRLRAAGFAVWPLDPPSAPLAVEAFPRLLVRLVAPELARLGGDRLRAAVLDAGRLPAGAHARPLRDNQDAFDAAVVAWSLWRARDGLPPPAAGAPYALEGRIWRP